MFLYLVSTVVFIDEDNWQILEVITDFLEAFYETTLIFLGYITTPQLKV